MSARTVHKTFEICWRFNLASLLGTKFPFMDPHAGQKDEWFITRQVTHRRRGKLQGVTLRIGGLLHGQTRMSVWVTYRRRGKLLVV